MKKLSLAIAVCGLLASGSAQAAGDWTSTADEVSSKSLDVVLIVLLILGFVAVAFATKSTIDKYHTWLDRRQNSTKTPAKK